MPVLRDAAGGQFDVFAERNPPGEFARVEVDRVQQPPGRLDRRVALVVEELFVARGPIGAVSRSVAILGFGTSVMMFGTLFELT